MKYIFITILIIITSYSYSQSATGCISGNCKKGEGTYRFINGDVYNGEFKNKKPDGKGKMEFENGNVYKGTFKKGEISGSGTMHYTNGDYFRGSWKNGKRDGSGGLMASNDKTKEYGVWKEDILVENKISVIAENYRWKAEDEQKEKKQTSTAKEEEESYQNKITNALIEASERDAQQKINYKANNSEKLTITSADCNLLTKYVQGIDTKFVGLYKKETERDHPILGSYYKVYDLNDKLFNIKGTYEAGDVLSDYSVFLNIDNVKEEKCKELIKSIALCLGTEWEQSIDYKSLEAKFKNGEKIVEIKSSYLGNTYYWISIRIE